MTFLLAGLTFVISYTVTNWLFSAFLATEWADNRFFAGGLPGSAFEAGFRKVQALTFDAKTVVVVPLSIAVAAVSSWLGLTCGSWLRRVVR